MTIKNLITYFRQFTTNHPILQTFSWGNLSDYSREDYITQYPAIHFVPQPSTLDDTSQDISFSVLIYDLLNEYMDNPVNSNQLDSMALCEEILGDFVNDFINQLTDYGYYLQMPVNYTYFVDRFKESVCGIEANITITIEQTACIPPYIVPSPTPSPTATLTPTPTPTPTLTPTPSSTPPPAFDADAAAYLEAVVSAGGSVDATMSAATDTLFTSLKSNGIYSKIKAMYPVLGGTAASHKFNAINPLDTNAAFRLTFTAGWTHSSSGMEVDTDPNHYANTYFNPSVEQSSTDEQHYSIYTTSNEQAQHTSMGAYDGSVEAGIYTSYSTTGRFYCSVGSGLSFYTQSTDIGIGNFVVSTTGTNTIGYKNGVSVINDVKTPQLVNRTMFLGGENGNGQTANNPLNIIFSTIGNKLSGSEISTMSSIINTFQTTLGRNTY